MQLYGKGIHKSILATLMQCLTLSKVTQNKVLTLRPQSAESISLGLIREKKVSLL